jgi:hypothetical protein
MPLVLDDRCSRSRRGDVSKIDIDGNGLGRWNNHADNPADCDRIAPSAIQFGAVELDAALQRVHRDDLVHPVEVRSKVDLPHPEGQ